MKIERDERRFDFHDIGLAIKRAREASGMTHEQLAYIVDRAQHLPLWRNENDGQHPSFNTFYQMVMQCLIYRWINILPVPEAGASAGSGLMPC